MDKMTFDEFQATAREVDSIGEALADESYSGIPGFIYVDRLFIDLGDAPEFLVLLPGGGKYFKDRTEAERYLYEWAYSEGYCDKPAPPATAGIVQWNVAPEHYPEGALWRRPDGAWFVKVGRYWIPQTNG